MPVLRGDHQTVPIPRCALLAAMGRSGQRQRFQILKAAVVESFAKELRRKSTDQDGLAEIWHRLFHAYASRCHTRADFSGLLPPIRCYRQASLPKGLDDSGLGKMLKATP